MHSARTMRCALTFAAARGTRAAIPAPAARRIMLPASWIASSRRTFSCATVRRSAVGAAASSTASRASATSPPSAPHVSPSPVPPYRTVLFASSPFSLPTLRALAAASDVVRTGDLIVVTPTDKVRGRGRELRESEFKREAKRLLCGGSNSTSSSTTSGVGGSVDGVPIAASGTVIDLPSDINFKMDGWDLPASLLNADPAQPSFDVGVVVSFGYMIPARLLRHFRAGLINIHPSLLPRHRGSAPIQYSIARGETLTGVSIIDVHPTRMDGGDVISQQATLMHSRDAPTFESMHDLLAEQGAKQLMQVLRNLEQARACRKEQTLLASSASASAAPTSPAAPSIRSDASSAALSFISPTIPPQVPSLAPRIPKHAGELLWGLHGPLLLCRISRALRGFTPVYTHFRGARIEVKGVLEPAEAQRRIREAAASKETPADFSFFPSIDDAKELGVGGLFFHGGLRAIGVLCAPATATATTVPSSPDVARGPATITPSASSPSDSLEVLYVTELHLANKPLSVSAETFAFGYLDKRVLTDPEAHWKQWRFVCTADMPPQKGQERKTLAQLDYWTAKLK